MRRAHAWRLAALMVTLVALGSSPRALAHASPASAAARPWYVPSYAKLQSGGYLGFITLGSGISVAQSRAELELLYGWVPGSLGGTAIHGLTLRALGRSRSLGFASGWRWTYLYGGPSVLFALGDPYFLRVPARYHDRRYYRRTGVHWIVALGTELTLPRSAPWPPLTHGVYAELSMLDEYVLTWLSNVGTIPFVSILSSSLGYRVRF